MTPAERGAVLTGAKHLGVEVDHSALDRLDCFLALLETWNRRIHLTGERERSVLIRKHVVDCLAVAPELPDTGIVVDVGTGAGFPGIVLACIRPDLEMVLLEPRRKATSFLREVARAVPLPQVRALELRADEAARDPVVSGRASIVVARALRLDVFLVAAAPLLSASGEAVAMQTPRTARVAGEGTAGLRLARRRDYTLPDGARRTLLVFRRTNLPVSSTHPLC